MSILQNFDDFRIAVESISGGSNTVIFDDMDMPSVMVAMPKMTNQELMPGGTDQVHAAWTVDNEIKETVYVSKFQNIVHNDRAYSLPGRLPRNHITFDQALDVCRRKGRGHHLMTNAMYAAVALLTRQMGIEPRGNNSWGRHFSAIHEKGASLPNEIDANGRTLRTLTGSGPASFYHDFTKNGIADLNGNVWEWASGLRIVDGEIQIIPYGNAMKENASHAPNSTQWRAIDQSGNLVAPGSAGTLKIDGTVTGNANEISQSLGGGIEISTTRQFLQHTGTNASGNFQHTSVMFNAVTGRAGTTIPNILRLLGIVPVANDISLGRFWLRNYGERLPLRGGDWNNGSGAGVFALLFLYGRAISSWNVGFRSAFVNL